MRFLHMADLHLGKRINGFSMIEDQKYMLKEILNIIDGHKVEVVLMAGDIYDKPVPTEDSVTLLNSFLNSLVERSIKVFIISGNHDSAQRIGFGADIMSSGGVYFSKTFDGVPEKIVMKDKYGKINIFMLPFIKPAYVRNVYPDAEITSYDEAMEYVINKTKINIKERNILIAHQYVRGGTKCESEDAPIGGIDEVGADNFKKFDYVALGHLHGPQHIGRETVRYSGTMLKYSFSEVNHKKSALIFDMKEKGIIEINKVPLHPMRDMREIKGEYNEIASKSFYKNMNVEDYLHVTLTDEEEKLNAIGLLRTIYPNIMKLDYDNKRTREKRDISGVLAVENKTPKELFAQLFELQNNQPMSKEQEKFVNDLIENVWEEDL